MYMWFVDNHTEYFEREMCANGPEIPVRFYK